VKDIKISLDFIEIMKKYRLQSRNWNVSSGNDEFTPGLPLAVIVSDNAKFGKEVRFGVSKKENMISSMALINGYLGSINGGS